MRLRGLVVLLLLPVFACNTSSKGPDVQGLVAALRSPREDVRGHASLELIGIGAPAAPAVAELLKDSDPHIRHVGATTLWGMGVNAAPAVSALAAALGDESSEVRVASAMALGGIGPAAAPAVPALAKVLKDKDGAVGREAADALGNIGPAAASAVPALVQAAKIEYMRPSAEAAVQKIKGGR
jgi:HEAT repeat protein